MLAGQQQSWLSIQISMSDDDANTLYGSGYSLYAYQAVSTNIRGWPTVWYKNPSITPLMNIQFACVFGAYTSTQTKVEPPQIVIPGAVYSMNLGQTLNVTGNTGTGYVTADGIAETVSILSDTATQLTTGTTQQNSTGAVTSTVTTCALPLYGYNMVLVEPLNQVLIVFESGSRSLGQTVRQLSAPSLLVAMDEEPARSVTYSLNTNWAANIQSWATQYPAGTDIADVLVSPDITPNRYSQILP